MDLDCEITLPRLARALPNGVVIRLEDFLPGHANSRCVELDLGEVQSTRHAFQLPESSLRDAAEEALNSAADVVRGHLESGRQVIFNYHATWYHTQSQGYLPSISPRRLRDEFTTATFVLNVIDDIFDVFVRLSREEELFHPRELKDKRRSDSLPPRSSMLMKILEWREIEWRITELTANELGAPYALLAAKHPMDTFVKLLTSNCATVYISHPITAPRTEGIDSDGAPLVEQISELSSLIGADDRACLIEPTTIDELRFVPSDDPAGPSLSPRWPYSRSTEYTVEGTMWDALTGPELALSEDPFGSVARAADRSIRADADRIAYELEWYREDDSSLTALKSAITRQINWRDRVLVAQSDLLFVMNPYSRSTGRLSGGVAAEIELHEQLMRLGEHNYSRHRERCRAFVYLPPDEEHARACAALRGVVESLMTAGRLVADSDGMPAALEESLIADHDVRGWVEATDYEIGRTLYGVLTDPRSSWTKGVAFHAEGPQNLFAGGSVFTHASQIREEMGKLARRAIIGEQRIGSYFGLSWFRESYCAIHGQEERDMRRLSKLVLESIVPPSE